MPCDMTSDRIVHRTRHWHDGVPRGRRDSKSSAAEIGDWIARQKVGSQDEMVGKLELAGRATQATSAANSRKLGGQVAPRWAIVC